jgi:hypothetical protein
VKRVMLLLAVLLMGVGALRAQAAPATPGQPFPVKTLSLDKQRLLTTEDTENTEKSVS